MMASNKSRLKETAKLFLKLGIIGFGGPAVHIALMEEEVVRKRKWMDHQHFLDLVGATNLIPGPNSTEMTMHCGHERAGKAGLLVAGACFILPAVLITAFFAWLYAEYGQLPEARKYIYGIKPAVIAVVLGAAYNLGKKAAKNTYLLLLGVAVLIAALLGVNEIIAMFAAGFLALAIYYIRLQITIDKRSLLLMLPASTTISKLTVTGIFLKFLKTGAILYGSGYVLFAFLDAELVATGFLERQQLIDAIAIGQFTPGPVLSAATFIGWQLGGWQGAVAATIGIFLPSFAFVWILNPLVPKMRASKPFAVFLDAVNVAAVAVIIAVVIEMGRDAITDWRTVLIAAASLLLVFFFKKLNSAWIILGGAAAGWLLSFV